MAQLQFRVSHSGSHVVRAALCFFFFLKVRVKGFSASGPALNPIDPPALFLTYLLLVLLCILIKTHTQYVWGFFLWVLYRSSPELTRQSFDKSSNFLLSLATVCASSSNTSTPPDLSAGSLTEQKDLRMPRHSPMTYVSSRASVSVSSEADRAVHFQLQQRWGLLKVNSGLVTLLRGRGRGGGE